MAHLRPARGKQARQWHSASEIKIIYLQARYGSTLLQSLFCTQESVTGGSTVSGSL